MVYALLSAELDAGVHALSIVAKTPDEVKNSDVYCIITVCLCGVRRAPCGMQYVVTST
jgi:hypothetical protein